MREHLSRKSSNLLPTAAMAAKIRQNYSIAKLMAALGLPLFLLIALTQTSAHGADNSNPNQSPFEKALQPYYPDIVKALLINGVVDPDLKGASADQMTAAMVTNGMQMLDDDAALEVLKLRAEMANRANTQVCAHMWTGDYGPSLIEQINALPDNQQRIWAAIFDRAALAIIRGKPRIPPPRREETQEAMRLILNGASPADSSSLVSAARNPQALDSNQLCVATRALYAGATRLPRTDALAIARTILSSRGS
jgi:hypothetical protein